MEEKYLKAFLFAALSLWLGLSLLLIICGIYTVFFYNGANSSVICTLALWSIIAGILAFARIIFVNRESKADRSSSAETGDTVR